MLIDALNESNILCSNINEFGSKRIFYSEYMLLLKIVSIEDEEYTINSIYCMHFNFLFEIFK